MPIKHSCFISYRHPKVEKGLSYAMRIVEALKAELDLRITEEVFLDRERLKGAEFYHEALAGAICQSVCMVVLYWPTYFNETHLFCAREFKAMEQLERERLRLLPAEEQVHGLIVLLAVRGFEEIPAEIKATRLCKDFEAHTMKPNWRGDARFLADVSDIGRYIAARHRAFLRLPPEAFAGCPSFRLPSEVEVRPWVQRIASPGQPFTNR